MAKEKTKKSVTKKPSTKKKVKKEGYLKSVRKEIGLVKWPTWKEVLKNTIATVVLCIVVCLFFVGLSLLLSFVKGWLS